jgi:hypothetical protein
MPLDATGFAPLPPSGARDLAVLKAARHRIQHRWRWGKGRRGKKPLVLWKHCALTALGSLNVSDTVFDRLHAQLPRGFRHIASYNDHPLTRHADVLAMFDRAIAALTLRLDE